MTTTQQHAAPPTALATALDTIDDHADTIEFPDHSVFADFTDEPWATLADMADALWAANNCLTAATALRDHLNTRPTHGTTATTGLVELIWCADPTPIHWATTLTIDNTTWVIDYTARQFDPMLPFPLVGTLNDWRETIAEAVETEWGWTNPVPHLH